MKSGKKYKFKHQSTTIVYLQKVGLWHQFSLLGRCGVWCELLDEDFELLEEF